MASSSRALLLLPLLALAGCTAMPDVSRVAPDAATRVIPPVAPSASARLTRELAIDRWWTLFNDPNLDHLIGEALARNEDIEAAVARVREAQASLDVARAAQSPTLDLRAETGASQRSAVSAIPLPPGFDRRAGINTLSVAAGYELDLWGRLGSTTAAARNLLLATEWARAAVEWGITARVAEAYFGLAAVERQIQVSEAVRAGRAANLKLRQREHEVGTGNEFDLRRAEAEVSATDSSLASLARERVSLERALTVLLGRTPTEIVMGSLPPAVLDEKKTFEAALPQGGAADLLVRRPDIRQAEAQLAASNENVEAARAATLPAVRLSGALGTDARSIGNLFSGPSMIWSLAANASQAIVDGGRLRARAREEHARAEEAVANYRKTVASAVLDVREAYAALDISQQALEAERARVASLARARALAQLGLEHGALSYLDFLDAERNWYQAQLSEVAAYRDRLTAQVAAFKALGGGYTAPANRQALN